MSLKKIEQYLESHGWTRKVAGDADFDAALLAIEQMTATGKGLIVSGEYGVGKTALAAIAARAFGGEVFKVRLAIPDDLDRFTRSWQEFHVENPYAQNAWLDDLGAENPVGIVSYALHGDEDCEDDDTKPSGKTSDWSRRRKSALEHVRRRLPHALATLRLIIRNVNNRKESICSLVKSQLSSQKNGKSRGRSTPAT